VFISVGLFKPEGSAKYLNKKKESKHEIVVTATCTVRNRTPSIPQDFLAMIGHKKNLDLTHATHFVCEFVEGGSASMTFRNIVTTADEQKRIEEMLKASLSKLALKIEGKASVEVDDSELFRNHPMTFKFCGDYDLAQHVSSFEQALTEISLFPKKLNGVNKTLTFKLMPISFFDSGALCICRQLSEKLVVETRTILVSFDDMLLEMKIIVEEMKKLKSTSKKSSSNHPQIILKSCKSYPKIILK